ncbi:hypothetical protein LINPERPRIM_LOCUS25727 [Linum perenne]
MGNCMVVEEVKVMRPDGKILEYTSPTLLLQQESQIKKKQEEEEEEEEEEERGSHDGGSTNGGVVRIKLVISKQQLQELLLKKKTGKVSVSEMVSQLQGQQRFGEGREGGEDEFHHQERIISWKPVLESIPEMG